MIADLLERGVGHIVAPDENIPGKEPKSGSESFLTWLLLTVAPDPAYEETIKAPSNDGPIIQSDTESPPPKPAARVPPASAFMSPPTKTAEQRIQCEHCKQFTPTRPTDGVPFQTPTPSKGQKLEDDIESGLANRVLSAAKGTAHSMVSPPALKDKTQRVFRLCASTTALQEKLLKKLRGFLTKNPLLLQARATGLGNLVQDSYTPLMAAADVNNIPAAKIILELDPKATSETDIRGRTALHIAALSGHTDMIYLLLQHNEAGGYEPDLNGRTPLGTALTSPNPKARKNKIEVEKRLSSRSDVSVFGRPLPPVHRETVHQSIELAYGEAEMPGKRVIMEDAKISQSWQNHFGELFCLLGVCDGHGDDGYVSQFVSENIATLVQNKTMQQASFNWQSLWNDVCVEVDDKLKEAGLTGGSTAVCALITKNEIIVANVGDSRCILVQKDAGANEGTGSNVPSLVEETESPTPPNGKTPTSETETAPGEDTAPRQEEKAEDAGIDTREERKAKVGNCIVYPLSEDHKPDLDIEKARIESAGMSVFEETFEEDGKEVTIHKVKKSGTNMMAVSRSFGDFEYKSNNEKGPEQQAVIALPEVRNHARNSDMDQFLLLACDGIWDVMSNEDAGKFVLDRYEKLPQGSCLGQGALSEISDSLIIECFDRGSRDNLSAIVVALSKNMTKFSGNMIEGKALTFASPKSSSQEV